MSFALLILIILVVLLLVGVVMIGIIVKTTTRRRQVPEVQRVAPCPHCGADVAPLNRHCLKCGHAVSPVEGDHKEMEQMG